MDKIKKLTLEEMEQASGGRQYVQDNPVALSLDSLHRKELGVPPLTEEEIEPLSDHSGGATGEW